MIDIHPIRSVISLSFIGSDFVLFFIIATLIGILLFLLFTQIKNKKIKKLAPIQVQKIESIQEIYLKKLKQIKKCWNKEESNKVCKEITKLLKDFMQRQKNISLQTKTTEESKIEIESQEVQNILEHLDSLKFSNSIFDHTSEIEKIFTTIEAYIKK